MILGDLCLFRAYVLIGPRIASLMMSLAPHSAKANGQQSMQFYVADGKYRGGRECYRRPAIRVVPDVVADGHCIAAYDAMHVSIIIAVGANFWPWIVLNLILGAIVLRHDFASVPLLHRTIGALFVKFAPHIFSVATLGWYDAGANNSVFVQAATNATI